MSRNVNVFCVLHNTVQYNKMLSFNPRSWKWRKCTTNDVVTWRLPKQSHFLELHCDGPLLKLHHNVEPNNFLICRRTGITYYVARITRTASGLWPKLSCASCRHQHNICAYARSRSRLVSRGRYSTASSSVPKRNRTGCHSAEMNYRNCNSLFFLQCATVCRRGAQRERITKRTGAD